MTKISLPDLNLSFTEVVSLCMLAGESVVFQNTEIDRHITYFKLMTKISLPDLNLSFTEVVSLCMLAGESVVFQNTEIDRHITTAIAKHMNFIPKKTRKHLSSLKRIFISKIIGSKNYTGREKMIAELIESMLNRTGCHITYHAFYTDQIEQTEIAGRPWIM